MTMLSVAHDVSMALTRLVVETDEDALVPQLHHKELPMPDWGFGLLAVVLFALGLAAVWSFRRVGAQRTWIVFTPVLLLANLFVAEQTIRLLPNLL